jgi:riboflavin synthase
MFSGIVEAVGTIRSTLTTPAGLRLSILAPFEGLALGESVCTNGVCLTVVALPAGGFEAEVSKETLRRSTLGKLRAGSATNLERSLRLGDRLSGHLVFGHVDGVGRLVSMTPEGDSSLYEFAAPPSVSRYLVEKGSVAVDGVSLTVFGIAGDRFAVAVIPHTAAVTTLGRLRADEEVNLESDMLAKYVEKAVAMHVKM